MVGSFALLLPYEIPTLQDIFLSSFLLLPFVPGILDQVGKLRSGSQSNFDTSIPYLLMSTVCLRSLFRIVWTKVVDRNHPGRNSRTVIMEGTVVWIENFVKLIASVDIRNAEWRKNNCPHIGAMVQVVHRSSQPRDWVKFGKLARFHKHRQSTYLEMMKVRFTPLPLFFD